MVLTKETFTRETHLKEQLEVLRKYIYNVAQRHAGEHQEQRMVGVSHALDTMSNIVDEVVQRRGKECDQINAKYGDK